MKKQLLVFLFILLMVNVASGIIIYNVYFPWITDYEHSKIVEQANSDVRDINFRFSLLDYNSSPQTSAKAAHELGIEIAEKELTALEFEEDSLNQLTQNQYMVFTDSATAPTGYILLKDKKTVLQIGPYSDSYNVVSTFDIFVYAIFTLIFNGLCIFILYGFISRQLGRGRSSLNQLNPSSVELKRKKDAFNDVVDNVPSLVEHISHLSLQHTKNLHSQRDLLHAVAHEFRGPMARLSFASDLFSNEESKNKQADLKHDMQEALDELDSLVKEVLDYSRLKDGQQPLDPNSINILQLANNVIGKIKAVYPDVNFKLNCQPASGFNCIVDEGLTERALLNLVRNAAKFSNQEVLISINNKEQTFMLKVEDNGNGIPPGKRERIFEPFTRLDHSRNRDSGGAGLGLSIVKGIVERQKGSVIAGDSQALGGAKFSIQLPLEVN